MQIDYTPNDIRRFWDKVDKSAGPDGCWPWTGAIDPASSGGIFWIKNYRFIRAYRFAYILHNGSIEPGMSVCHTCDNPPCCNPAHLWLGTQRDNMADRTAKGRTARGERQHLAKLTEGKVREIRILASHGMSSRELAEEYHVSTFTIRAVVHRKTWKHVA